MNTEKLKYVWAQKQIPVVLRRTGKGQRLRVRLPYAETNRQWLQNTRRMSPDWIASKEYWELPKAWFNDFVDRALAKYAKGYIIQPYREQEKCAPQTADSPVLGVFTSVQASSFANARSVPRRFVLSEMASRCRRRYDRRYGARSGS